MPDAREVERNQPTKRPDIDTLRSRPDGGRLEVGFVCKLEEEDRERAM